MERAAAVAAAGRQCSAVYRACAFQAALARPHPHQHRLRWPHPDNTPTCCNHPELQDMARKTSVLLQQRPLSSVDSSVDES